MKQFSKWIALSLVFVLSVSCVLVPIKVEATAADYVTLAKTINKSTITTEEEAEVTLNVTGTPPVNVIVPNDVILIIDKSGSMLPGYNNGEDKMTNAKEAAKGFIDLMDLTKHRVGIVDFSSPELTRSFNLSTDKVAAKSYIDTISANGSTATGDAIQTAMDLLIDHRPEAQPVIIILTDGDATVPTINPYEYAKQKAQSAKDQGIIFYTIALLKQLDNPDTSGPNILLKEMATTSSHHHFVLGSTGLSEIYEAIVKEIGLASAYDITINDVVSDDFEIVPGSYDHNIPKPTVVGNTITWEFNELKNNTLTFSYKIKPKSKTKVGYLPVTTTESKVTYKDYAGGLRTKLMPNVSITVKYPAPVITSIVEPSGHPSGGNVVTINGSNFLEGANVQFGGIYATSIDVIDDKQIQATVPAGAQGTVKVTVINPDLQRTDGSYQYITDPIISSISPTNGPLAGGDLIVINGNYLMSGVEVFFGNKQATLKTYGGPTYMKVIAPPGNVPGPIDITFTNPDGTTLTVPGGYTYNEPPVETLELTTVSPNKGALAGGEVIYIDGKKIDPNAKLYFGTQEFSISTYYSDTRIKVIAPPSLTAGVFDVRVVNPDGAEATLVGAYTYEAPPELPAPTITAITPANGPLIGGTVLYVDGTNFVNGLKIYFGSKEGTVSNFYSATRLKVIVPPGDVPGLVDVRIVNPDNKEASLTGGYLYDAPPAPPAPSITQISPATGLVSGGEVLYLDGTGLQQGVKVFIGTNEATVQNYYNETRLKLTAPAGVQAGKVDVKVVNPDGQEGLLVQGYEYTVPAPEPISITSITPNKGLTKGGQIVVISGVNFKQGIEVRFGSALASLYAFDSSTQIRVIAPASATATTVDVTLTNLDGQTASATQAFTYELSTPSVTNMTPNHGPMSGGTIVYVDGTNFEANMTVRFNGTVVPMTTFYNATRFKITVPASAVSGSVPVVITLASGTSVTTSYTYDAPPPAAPPVITQLSVTSSPIAGGGVVYIDGTGFQQGMKIYFGSTEAQIMNFYSSIRIKVRIPAGSAGPTQVKIVNPDGQQSNLFNFTYV